MDSYDGILADEAHQQQQLDIHEETIRKKKHINLTLLAKRCLDKKMKNEKLSAEVIARELNGVTHVRLDRENLHSIDGLELLGSNVKNLYLQHNEISTVENLDTLTELTFLTLSNNHITRVENLDHLHKLGFLDLSHNNIQELDEHLLPKSLVLLSLEGNACQKVEEYRTKLLHALPRLRQLDGQEIPLSERRAAGHDVESEDDSDEEEDVLPSIKRPFDVDILGVFDELSTDIFMRCQSRIQEVYNEHKERVSDLDSIRSCVPIEDSGSSMSHSLRLDSPDTDTSRPTTAGNESVKSQEDDEQSLRSVELDFQCRTSSPSSPIRSPIAGVSLESPQAGESLLTNTLTASSSPQNDQRFNQSESGKEKQLRSTKSQETTKPKSAEHLRKSPVRSKMSVSAKKSANTRKKK